MRTDLRQMYYLSVGVLNACVNSSGFDLCEALGDGTWVAGPFMNTSPDHQSWNLECEDGSYQVIKYSDDSTAQSYITIINNLMNAVPQLPLSNVPHSPGFELNVAFGRIRISDHQVIFRLRRDSDGTATVVSAESTAELQDLYDFSFNAGLPAPLAATLQLGFGDNRPESGKFFKDKFVVQRSWTEDEWSTIVE